MSDPTNRRFATTLARGLGILRAFRPTDDGLGNQDIAERTGLPKPTVSRLTFTLCALGYLTHGKKHDKYRLGPAALALGQIAAASLSFVDRAAPDLQRLADETGTLISMAIADGDRMMLVKTWRPVGSASIWLEVGHRLPILGSSSGKAYLAALDEGEFARLSDRLADVGAATAGNLPPNAAPRCAIWTARGLPGWTGPSIIRARSTPSPCPFARLGSARRWCSSAGPLAMPCQRNGCMRKWGQPWHRPSHACGGWTGPKGTGSRGRNQITEQPIEIFKRFRSAFFSRKRLPTGSLGRASACPGRRIALPVPSAQACNQRPTFQRIAPLVAPAGGQAGAGPAVPPGGVGDWGRSPVFPAFGNWLETRPHDF